MMGNGVDMSLETVAPETWESYPVILVYMHHRPGSLYKDETDHLKPICRMS